MAKRASASEIVNHALPASPATTARLLLRLIRASQPVSRIELSRRLGVNRSTVTDIVNPLIAVKFLRETTLSASKNAGQIQGRPPIGLMFNNEQDYFVGVNIGVRGSQIGLATLAGESLAEIKLDTLSEPIAALKLIRENVAELCSNFPNRRLRAVGVSVPGPTDPERRRLLSAVHLGWKNVAVADALENAANKQNVAIVVENDATAAARYEARLRLADANEKLLENFILLRSGTGIGVGLLMDGEIYRGTNVNAGFAGEFGHTTIVAGGKLCACGNRGCWEMYASAAAAAALYAGDRLQFAAAARRLRFVEVVERAEAGEIRARRTLERVGEYLGIGIGNLITGLGIPRVILSGRIVYGYKFLREAMTTATGKSMAGKLSDWSIEAGEPQGAGIGGALEIAVEEYLMRGT